MNHHAEIPIYNRKPRIFTFEYDFTVNQWGGFEMGDGEYFFDSTKKLKLSTPDWFIKTVQVGEKIFETTYIPSNEKHEESKNWEDDSTRDLFTSAVTYRTDESQIIEWLIWNRKIGIYDLYEDYQENVHIELDNFLWYFIGVNQAGKKVRETEIKDHPLFKELEELEINSFNYCI